jgi:ABC-2 type transport system permease protein
VIASSGAVFSTGSSLRMLAEHTRAQLLSFTRNVALSAASVVMPVLLFGLIGMTGAERPYAPGVAFGAYFLASMGAYAVSGTMVFNFGVTVAVERGQKLDLLIRAAPVPPLIYLLARVLTALAFSVIALVILFVFAYGVVGVRLAPGVWLELGAVLLFGSLPFIGLGFAIAYLAGPNAAVAVANITYLVLAFLSGIFIPFESLPSVVQGIAPLLPTYHYAQLAWGAVGLRGETALESWTYLLGYGVVFFAIALIAYRRDERRRFS